MTRRRLAAAGLLLAALTSCGSGSSPPASPALSRPVPNLPGFLQLPVATPSACPPASNGTTVGRASPWVGTVDVSVFLTAKVTTHQVLAVGNYLRSDPQVQHAYFESQHQAYQEFQRLYTCWKSVAASQTPASYRIVLVHGATLVTRDLLVSRLLGKPGVDTVSCDPSVPCTNIVRPSTPTPVASHTHRR